MFESKLNLGHILTNLLPEIYRFVLMSSIVYIFYLHGYVSHNLNVFVITFLHFVITLFWGVSFDCFAVFFKFLDFLLAVFDKLLDFLLPIIAAWLL